VGKHLKVPDAEIAFMPARCLLQDFTGVPAVVISPPFANAIVQDGGGGPKRVNELLPPSRHRPFGESDEGGDDKRRFTDPTPISSVQRGTRERYSCCAWAQTEKTFAG